MANKCAICGKGTYSGKRVTRRGRAKKDGGAGRKITGRSKSKQKPNLQKVKALIEGKKKKVKVCTSCLKSGKVTRAY